MTNREQAQRNATLLVLTLLCALLSILWLTLPSLAAFCFSLSAASLAARLLVNIWDTWKD